MSTYRNEWDCCGAITETDSYEPDACPFCLVDTLTEQVRAQDKWISGLTQPDNCLPVYAVKNFTMRFKEYKPSSQQAKRGIIGRWQEHDGYGWTNCEPPEKYSTTPPKEAE